MSASPRCWIILTGEYPPQTGGVSDYTRLVACALAEAGDEVHVWAPPTTLPERPAAGVHLHRLADHFSSRALSELDRALAPFPAGTPMLVQYVPHAFGRRAMNLPFCRWVHRQRRRFYITVMFHEVAFSWVGSGRILRHNFLAAVNRLMAFFLVRSARRLCVSIPAWEKLLRPYAGHRPVEWLPVPSNIPQAESREGAEALRGHLLLRPEGRLVGHFGTFGGSIARALRRLVPEILRVESRVQILLIGRGSTQFLADLEKDRPALAGRIAATGELEPDRVSDHLAACDLLVQPYVDGISSRRGSAMAGLACGMPIVTTRGPLTEPVWEESGAVCLANSVEEMTAKVTTLLEDDAACARLRRAARELYRERFALERTIAALRSAS